MMIQRVLNEDNDRIQLRKQVSESIQNELKKAYADLQIETEKGLSTTLTKVEENQEVIESESLKLVRLHRQVSQCASIWKTNIMKYNQDLKGLKDIKNWSYQIEKDLQMVSSSLEYVTNQLNRHLQDDSSSVNK